MEKLPEPPDDSEKSEPQQAAPTDQKMPVVEPTEAFPDLADLDFSDTTEPTPETLQQLDKVIEKLLERGKIKMERRGHTEIGNNLELDTSVERSGDGSVKYQITIPGPRPPLRLDTPIDFERMQADIEKAQGQDISLEMEDGKLSGSLTGSETTNTLLSETHLSEDDPVKIVLDFIKIKNASVSSKTQMVDQALDPIEYATITNAIEEISKNLKFVTKQNFMIDLSDGARFFIMSFETDEPSLRDTGIHEMNVHFIPTKKTQPSFEFNRTHSGKVGLEMAFTDDPSWALKATRWVEGFDSEERRPTEAKLKALLRVAQWVLKTAEARDYHS